MKDRYIGDIYGFRFQESSELPLSYLYAVGHERINSPSYSWDGLQREDGPLLLFQYTLAGEGHVSFDEQIFTVSKHTAFLADIPSKHRYYYPSNGQEPWEFIFILIRPQLVLPLWQEVCSRKTRILPLPPDSSPIVVLGDIYGMAKAGHITDALQASTHVYSFVAELLRYATKGQKLGWPPAVQQAASYIEANYKDMIDQNQLSEHLEVSKFHLLRTFSRYVGATPNEYLNRVRIEQAIVLLQETNMSIDDIAAQIGYATGSYFIKVFRKLTGQTPGAFRSGKHSLQYRRLFFD